MAADNLNRSAAPRDLCWHSYVGAGRSARHLRDGKNGVRLGALGMLEGPSPIRFANAPKGTADAYLAEEMASDRENLAAFDPRGLRTTQPV